MRDLQTRMEALAHTLYLNSRGMVVVFEGWDAAGKGGAIKRLIKTVDSRGYVVNPIAAPEGDDREHHYLWRFWRRLVPPAEKQIQIFDRSWYGRVLVERVEGFCPPEAWQRAYGEINEFEREITDAGILLLKFWLHISSDEQMRRFEARRDDPARSWKLTDEDWRNRDKRPQYEAAVEDMLQKTSVPSAPWIVVPANDKRFARVTVLCSVVERIEKEFGRQKAKTKA
ncbi:MAG: hypothetical protein GYA17_02475 [Chloroflexi bacterium]|nr:hypothetical protein [Chloroflexota bacterium]